METVRIDDIRRRCTHTLAWTTKNFLIGWCTLDMGPICAKCGSIQGHRGRCWSPYNVDQCVFAIRCPEGNRKRRSPPGARPPAVRHRGNPSQVGALFARSEVSPRTTAERKARSLRVVLPRRPALVNIHDQDTRLCLSRLPAHRGLPGNPSCTSRMPVAKSRRLPRRRPIHRS